MQALKQTERTMHLVLAMGTITYTTSIIINFHLEGKIHMQFGQ